MEFTAFDYAMWLLAAVVHLTILTVMAKRRLIRELPIFFTFVLWSLASSMALFIGFRLDGYTWYFYRFWAVQAILNALIFAVVYEVYAHVFKNYAALRRLGTVLFSWTAVVLLVVAIVIAASAPGSDASRMMAGLITLERSVRVVQVGLLLFIVIFASHFRLSWRHCVFGLTLGLGAYAGLQLIAVSLRAHIGESANAFWGRASGIAYLVGAVVWTRYLSMTETTVIELGTPQKEELERWNQALAQLLHR